MKRIQWAAICCALGAMLAAGQAAAASDNGSPNGQAPGEKWEINDQGDRVNSAGGIRGTKDQTNDQGDTVNTAGGTKQALLVDGLAVDGAVVRDGDTVLVPLRAVAEALGYGVAWSGKNGVITLTHGGTGTSAAITLRIGKDTLVRSDNRAYVPVSFLTGTLKASVTDDGQTVDIEA